MSQVVITVATRVLEGFGVIALCAACTNTAPVGSSTHPGMGSGGSNGASTAPPSPSTPRTAQSPIAITTVLHFSPHGATPGPALAPRLDEVAEILHANPSVMVEIAGHADPQEAEGVAHARANLVASSLAARGIPRARLTVRGYGHRQPAADGQHRRVEFKVQQPTAQ